MQKKSIINLVIGFVLFTVLLSTFLGRKTQAATINHKNDESSSLADICSMENVMIQGQDLTAEEVNKLEEQLVREPNDLISRAKLLGFYQFAKFPSEQATNSYRQHKLWIIENKPDTEIASSSFVSFNPILDGESFFQARKIWLQHIDKNPDNAALIGNAASFFLLNDSNLAESLLKKAQTLEPQNPKWPQSLAHLYELGAYRQTSSGQSENAKKTLAEMEKSLELADSELEKFYTITDLAKNAYNAGDLNKAENYAKELLHMAPKYPKDWNYGNAIHTANIVLGRIALARGDIETAKKYLIEAGKTPGSPQLNSFGPNMMLAKELLEKKETQAVLDYFELCGKFWKEEKLNDWSELVRNGKIPDFGGNLFY